MDQAWQIRDVSKLAEFACWLKGVAGTVGYDDFTEPATTLEEYAKSGQLDKADELIKQIKSLAGAVEPPKSTLN